MEQENKEKNIKNNIFFRILKKQFSKFFNYIKNHANILEGTDREGTVNGIIRDIEFKGPNLWILVCSIFIASVGLNTNSTAVIIGAMLISPLMGPIIGVGYSVAVFDLSLLFRALRNFGMMVLFAVITSTIYFLISPLSEVQSELLARTRPTTFDVLIAFFGGLAGIIAGSRKEKSNVVAGVAIATALMPPLCTAGFGIAIGDLNFFLGAFYLFFINSVFICLASYIGVKLLNFEKKQYIDKAREKKVKLYITVFSFIIIIPSLFIAINVVNESVFKESANNFIKDNISTMDNVFVINKEFKYNSKESVIELSIVGTYIDDNTKEQLKNEMAKYRLANTKLIINQAKDESSELAKSINQQVRTGIIEDLYKKNEQIIKNKDDEIEILKNEIKKLENNYLPVSAISKELKVQYPQISKISMSIMETIDTSSGKSELIPTIIIYCSSNLPKKDKQQIEKWIVVRINVERAEVIYK